MALLAGVGVTWYTEAHVRYLVARMRSAYSRRIGDPDWEEDIRRLASLSREFADLWARHEVADPEPRTLTYLHPRRDAEPGRQRARAAGHARGAHRRLHATGRGHPGEDAADPPGSARDANSRHSGTTRTSSYNLNAAFKSL